MSGEHQRSGTGRIGHGGRARRADPSRRSATTPAQRGRTGDPARRLAWDVLRAVDGGAYANLELPRRLRRSRLHARDAAFVSELVYGSLRRRGLYDPIIERCAGRPVGRIDPPVLDVLRLGAHQILSMRVPGHAAVDESVALAREVVGAGAAGFVNAVLRRITEKDGQAWQELIEPDDEIGALAVRHSHPAWIVRALRAALLGHGTATEADVAEQLLALLEADNAPPKVTLVARPGLADLDELVAGGAERTGLSPYGAVLPEGDPGALPAVRQGRAAVQDEGSQLLTLALAGADGGPAAGQRWLDLCAGPGGKAALLAALALRGGAVLFANEISEHRTELLRSALAAALDAGAEVMIGTGDGRSVGAEDPRSFDRVLVDAPCTGLGALRRRPEARWRRTPADVAQLAALQRDLLASAVDAAAPGGLVGYATCSPHLAETRVIVGDLLAAREDVTAVDARPLFVDAAGAPVPHLGAGPYVQLWPHLHGTDAMFFALLRKS